jgi:hypothetical protein
MKTLISFLFALLFLVDGSAQITVTSENTASIFAEGNTQTFHAEFVTQMVDIGQPGGGNVFDFSELDIPQVAQFSGVNVANTPYASDYPDADICLSATASFEDFTVTNYQYFANDEGLDIISLVSEFSSLPNPDLETYSPFWRILSYPMTFGTQWSSNTTITPIESGDVGPAQNLESEFLVDAYGTLLLPGGIADEALRIRETTIIDGGPALVSYVFWTNSGAILELSLTGGQNSPNSGMVETDDIGYGSNLLPLSTAELFPEGYGLTNSYPNPFLDFLTLDLNLSRSSDVSFVITDITGKVVRNEFWAAQPSGINQRRIETNELAPGVYLGTIQAGPFTESIKLIKSD